MAVTFLHLWRTFDEAFAEISLILCTLIPFAFLAFRLLAGHQLCGRRAAARVQSTDGAAAADVRAAKTPKRLMSARPSARRCPIASLLRRPISTR